MLLHLVKDSLVRRRRRVALTSATLLVGTALVTALFTVSLDIEEKVGRELRSFGANISLTTKSGSMPVEIGGVPVARLDQQAYLPEADLPRLKRIFWKNNITAFAPFLYGEADAGGRQVLVAGTWFKHDVVQDDGVSFHTGLREVSPMWQVEGQWPSGAGQALVGRELAAQMGLKPGDRLTLSRGGLGTESIVAGIVSGGGPEDGQVFLDLSEAQALLGLPGKVEKVQVSALTKPPDELARRAQALDSPRDLPPEEYEKWYCSPYIDAITWQIEEVFPGGTAKADRRIAEAEGAFLGKMKLLFILIAGTALAASALGVGATMSATVMERRTEIGLMKALGAQNFHVAGQFLLEAAASGLIAGAAGFGAGLALAALIGREVFGTVTPPTLLALPFALIVSLGVALAGSALPVRRAMRIRPIKALKG